jgi:hypothetical protein
VHDHSSFTLAEVTEMVAKLQVVTRRRAPEGEALRFEERVQIQLRCYETDQCAGSPMQLAGNLSLREAGADATRLAYTCAKCFRRVTVSDAWHTATSKINAAHDEEP